MKRVNHMFKILKVEVPRKLKVDKVQVFEKIILRNPPLLIKGVKESLELLIPKYRNAIVSDTGMTPGKILRRVLERHRVLDFFDTTILSDETGYNKPHKIMFETALRILDAEPSEAIHIGDLLETDIAGAKSVGMKAIWINREGLVNPNPDLSYYEVHDISQIIPIIRNIK
jgi:putative hydrolase of the HAD superfamily